MWGIVGAILGFLVDTAVSIAEAVWAALGAVWAVVSPIFQPLVSGAEALWNDVLVPLWNTIRGWFMALKGWFDSWAGPLKTWLGKIYKVEQDLYKAFFRPVLDTISRLRQVLQLSGLSHTALGEAIEGVLSQVYVDVNNVYQSVVSPVNQLVNTIENYILQADGLINQVLLLNSVFQSFGAIWDTWWNVGIHTLTADAEQHLKDLAKWPQPRAAHEQLTTYLETGGGELEPNITAGLTQLTAMLALEDLPDVLPFEEE